MANARALARNFPATLTYKGRRHWVRRGDVLAYAPKLQTAAFSTDEFGFRHTVFEGRDIGLRDVAALPRVGILLGSSHVFGFGLNSNAETLASNLSSLIGYPILNISFPEADSRTLHTMLVRLLRSFERRIAVVIVINGGEFTRYCFTEQADPVFGPPSLPLGDQVRQAVDDGRQFANMLQFVTFWMRSFGTLSSRARVRLVFGADVTFFEKSIADEIEQRCELGVARTPSHEKRFGAHRRTFGEIFDHRRQVATEAGLTLMSYPPPDELLFIDEFHYRAQSQRLIAETIVRQLENP
jgi:hypothetical protein